MIEIYYAPPSIYGRKVLAVLEEKNLDYEIKKMSFEAEDHKKENYLKLNPNGEIPTLVDEGFVIYESTAIIEYLNDEYPEPPLMPEDSNSRALIRMIEDYCDLHVYPVLARCYLKKIVKKEELNEEDKKHLDEKLKRLEGYLGEKVYMAGDFSLADCAVMVVFPTLEVVGLYEELVSEKLKAYAERLKKRRGWRGATLLSFEETSVNA